MSGRRSRTVEKRKERKRAENQARHRQRENLKRILELMGLGGLENELNESASSILARVFPSPRVVVAPRLAPDGDLQAKAAELGRDLNKVGIRIGGDYLSHADFFTVCLGLHYLTQLRRSDSTSAGGGRGRSQVMNRLMRFKERHEPEMLDGLFGAVRKFLALNSRLDGAIYTVRHGASIEGRKFVCTTTLDRIAAVPVQIESGGFRRPAFRCGVTEDYDSGAIAWTGWDSEVLGPDAPCRLPVYIQSHAIAQAYKRLSVDERDRSLHFVLAQSLHHPRIVLGRDGQLLVDVRFRDERVGYLVAERLPDAILVKTFLLVTMRGTPEGERLHRRLRLSRADLEYLELDDFAKLAFTDLLKDDDVARIFVESGCEGLLTLARQGLPFDIPGNYATRFKSYFGQSLDLAPGNAWPGMSPGWRGVRRTDEEPANPPASE